MHFYLIHPQFISASGTHACKHVSLLTQPMNFLVHLKQSITPTTDEKEAGESSPMHLHSTSSAIQDLALGYPGSPEYKATF